jgi:hypothetical protein
LDCGLRIADCGGWLSGLGNIGGNGVG